MRLRKWVISAKGVSDPFVDEETADIPWFHGIINTFSLSLVCPKAFFVLILV